MNKIVLLISICFCLNILTQKTSIAQKLLATYNKNSVHFKIPENSLGFRYTTILIDKIGNVWIGSTRGLYKYNGSKIIRFTENDGLSHNHIMSIYEDRNGLLWIGTIDGLSIYNGKNFSRISITTIRGEPLSNYKKPKIANFNTFELINAVRGIFQDKRGIYWFSTISGIHRYDGKSFSNFTINDSVTNNTNNKIGGLSSILDDNEGNIWFGSGAITGLFCYDGKELKNFRPIFLNWGNATTKKQRENYDTNIDGSVPAYKDKEGNLWFINRSSVEDFAAVFKLKASGKISDSNSYTRFTSKDCKSLYECSGIMQDRRGNYWFITDNYFGNATKACIYDGSTFKTLTIANGSQLTNGIAEDNKNNIWLLCDYNIYKYDGNSVESMTEQTIK
jgi:ligand-binding sensor domain-containing protein